MLWLKTGCEAADRSWFEGHRDEVDGVGLSRAEGWTANDLSGLADWGLGALFVPDARGIKLRTVAGMTGLRALRCVGSAAVLDLRRLHALELLHAAWSSRSRLPTELDRLTDCALWGFRPSDGSASELTGATNLRSLQLIQGGIRTLKGLPPEVAELELNALNTLWNLDGAPKSVTELRVLRCANLADIGGLAGCQDLRTLVLADCGAVRSLGPLRGLNSLRRVVVRGTTEIVDGDLHPLLGLDEVVIDDRATYNLTADELRAGRRERSSLKA